MKIQRARLLLVLISLTTLAGSQLAAQAPPGALDPSMGPGQLPPSSPYYGILCLCLAVPCRRWEVVCQCLQGRCLQA